MSEEKSSRWYPTSSQLKDPEWTERSFRQMLKQHYDLQDQVNGMREQMASDTRGRGKKPDAPPPGSGPSDSMLLGLRVAPVDSATLADGTTLTYVKAAGNFQFK
jgi:hypothetical protein